MTSAPLIGPAETRLPEGESAQVTAAANREGADLAAVAAGNPASSLAWALLAEAELRSGAGAAADVRAYAFARTGYHRGLDALRRSGWKGAGPVPWSHEPNRGFLRALRALGIAAGRIGEVDEEARCAAFLRDSDPEAPAALD